MRETIYTLIGLGMAWFSLLAIASGAWILVPVMGFMILGSINLGGNTRIR